MIDGAMQFHYLGLSRVGQGLVLVFKEGMLILRLDKPGFGVMSPSALAGITPRGSTPSSSSSASRRSSDDEGHTSEDSIELLTSDSASNTHSTTTSSASSATASPSGSQSPSSSRSVSPSPERSPEPPAWLLGWHPFEALVHLCAISERGAASYGTGFEQGQKLEAFVAQLKAGQWDAQPPGSHGYGLAIAYQMYGQLQLEFWPGPWVPANNETHQHSGLSAARACELVAHSVLADHHNLAGVADIERQDFLGWVDSGAARVLAFERGLLVEHHPDPAVVGWHPMDNRSHADVVSSETAGTLLRFAGQKSLEGNSYCRLFFQGALNDTHGTFCALVYSHKLQNWQYLAVDAPHGLSRPGEAQAPAAAALRFAMEQARPAQAHDVQYMQSDFALDSGNWDVPVFLGILRCVDILEVGTPLMGIHWHDALRPLLELFLHEQSRNESAWLASGAIRMPVAQLINLMRRDTRLRRPEVSVMCPVDLVATVFKMAAPKERATVIAAPTAIDVDKALQTRLCSLLVFEQAGKPEQSVVLAHGAQCWEDTQWSPIEVLKARVARALASAAKNGKGERLVAVAYLNI